MVGTMIEVPRGALTADEIAQTAEFFSFGTNDLTQTCLGMSRDDSGTFLPPYAELEIIKKNPFASIDQAGIGQLMKIAVEKGHKTRPDIKLGICGEHGGDPDVREILPQDRPDLRELLAVPRAGRAPRRRPGRAGRRNREKGEEVTNHQKSMQKSKSLLRTGIVLATLFGAANAFAGDADINLPDLTQVTFPGVSLGGHALLYLGLAICAVGALFGFWEFVRCRALPVHKAMSSVSNMIWETCKTYLAQQGKFLVLLWALIAACIVYYFCFLQHKAIGSVLVILASSVLGILGSYGVAWFGIRINTYANSRAAFASLRGNSLQTLMIPLRSGMSIGLLLVCVELVCMIGILLFMPRDLAGPCFIGFAIGESLGAAALRIGGGIFTKIADIGSDLMKIVFNLPEDDPKNPGVIADCTGDNAGDSVGPTADGFETYGVTGVALISFLALSLGGAIETQGICGQLIVWIFVIQSLMVLASLGSFYVNKAVSNSLYGNKKDFNWEQPLTNLVWLTSIVSIVVAFVASWFLLGGVSRTRRARRIPNLWWVLAGIVSCGTLAGPLIMEFTKIFVSTKSRHVKEIVTCSGQGGASLNILSGFVTGNFCAFWMGLVIIALMFGAYMFSQNPALLALMPEQFKFAAPIFAFGLVAFGFLAMAPVIIAVDSFGPVTDNAQSIYELSRIESVPNVRAEIEKDFGFKPDFENSKLELEKGDGAGNTFKATAKPVLIGTAVVGATTMIFGIIMLLQKVGIQTDPNFDIISM